MLRNIPIWHKDVRDRLSSAVSKLALFILALYWIVAAIIGTLVIANFMVVTHVPDLTRVVVAELIRESVGHSARITLCGGSCFEESTRQYHGFRIDPTVR